jgi:hypothetical protein
MLVLLAQAFRKHYIQRSYLLGKCCRKNMSP